MNMCSCMIKQALLTTSEAALYLGVPPSYLICARSPKCSGCFLPPPQFVRLRTEKKGAKWIRYTKAELDRWLASLPLQEKTEIGKTGNETDDIMSLNKRKECVWIMAILQNKDFNKISPTILKSLLEEVKENKQYS